MIQEVFFQDKHFKDLNPLSVGYERCASGYSCGPEIRHNYWIQYIVSGCGIYETESKTYNLKSGQAFIIPPSKKAFSGLMTNIRGNTPELVLTANMQNCLTS